MLSLKKLQIFSEKINYRKLHPQDIYSVLADKFAVRDYVAETIGENYLIPLKYLVSSAEEFPELDGYYVAKTTHGSGPDHLEFFPTKKTLKEIKNKFQLALATEFRGVRFGKLHFASIPRKIMVEEKNWMS